MRKSYEKRFVLFLAILGQAVFYSVVLCGYTAVLYAHQTSYLGGRGIALWAFASALSFLLAFFLLRLWKKYPCLRHSRLSLFFLSLGASVLVFFMSFTDPGGYPLLFLVLFSSAFFLCAHHIFLLGMKFRPGASIRVFALLCGTLTLSVCAVVANHAEFFHFAEGKDRTLLYGLAAILCFISSLPPFFLPSEKQKNSNKTDIIQEKESVSVPYLLFFAGAFLFFSFLGILAVNLGLRFSLVLYMLPAAYLSAAVAYFFFFSLSSSGRGKAGILFCALLCFTASLLPIAASFYQKPSRDFIREAVWDNIEDYSAAKDWDAEKENILKKSLGPYLFLPGRQDLVTGELLRLLNAGKISIDEAVDLNDGLILILGEESIVKDFEDKSGLTALLFWIATVLGAFGVGALWGLYEKGKRAVCGQISLYGLMSLFLFVFSLLSCFSDDGEWAFMLFPVCFLGGMILFLKNENRLTQKEDR